MIISSYRYRGRLIEILRGQDDCSVFYDALIDGTPAVLYSPSPAVALATVRLLID
jgi:hypothetical protein